MTSRISKYLPIILAAVFLASCGGSDSGDTPPVVVEPDREPEQVTIGGAGNMGIFDPSVARDPASGRLWMSYSSVNSSSFYASNVFWLVSIRLAYSDDNGVSWTDADVVAAPHVEAVVGPMTESHPTGEILVNSAGIWQSETSSLIYDPGAPVAERWKLLIYQYLNANLISYFADHGWMTIKMAATPLELADATSVKLFGGIGLKTDGSNTGSPVFSPTGGMPAIQLNTDLSQSVGGNTLTDLDLCAFAEPGLHATDSAMYMAIFCADISTNPLSEHIEYFRCDSPCDVALASSWEYLGRLLTIADAQTATGDHHYQAPDFVEKDGKTYLLVTPVNNTVGNLYNGCRVYEFEDLNTTQLKHTNGILTEVARVNGDTDTHHGACSTFADVDGGILLSQLKVNGTEVTFTIYKSQVSLP
ncbi:sialidase family protein [Pseudomonadota bacterium]